MFDFIFSYNALWWLLLLLYLPSCFGLIVIVLLQKGKGVGFAGAFGMGGGADTVFGPRSAKSLPQRLTYGAAAIFMVLAMVMSTVSGKVGKGVAPGLADETVPVESASIDALLDDSMGAATEDGSPAPITPVVVDAGAEQAADGNTDAAPAAEVTEMPPELSEDAAPAEAAAPTEPAPEETPQ